MKGEWRWIDTLWLIIPIFAIISVALSCFIFGLSYGRNHTDEVVWQDTIQLDDTRRVPCVATDYGMSCDWLHADGTDAHISDEGTTQ